MTTILPLDDDSNPIPAIRLKAIGGAHAINATATTARNTTPFDGNTRVISLYATGPVYVRFGDTTATATASDHYFPSGVYYDFSIGGGPVPHYSHIAVLAASADCVLYVSEKE